LQKIKLKKNTNPMIILSGISAVKVRFKKTLDEEIKIEVVQGCAGDNYAQVIVAADGIAQLKPGGACNATTALELCKAMIKVWQIAGHNDDNKEDDDNDDDSVGLETSSGAVKHKQALFTRRNASTAARQATGHHFVLTRKEGKVRKSRLCNWCKRYKNKVQVQLLRLPRSH
jgi:hypothetical protein